MRHQACVDVLGTHRLIQPAGNLWYLFETRIVPLLLDFDFASVLFHVGASLRILDRLLLDVDFAGFVFGRRHGFHTTVMATHSTRTRVVDRQIVFAVL